DSEAPPELRPKLNDNLVPTGFLRMAPDPTWANITGFPPERLEVIADEIDVLGSAVRGLTLKCARCHSHKYDPIPQRDYYRLVDVFKGAFDEHDWLKPDVRPGLGPVSEDVLGGRHLPYVPAAERRAWQGKNPQIHRGNAAPRAGPPGQSKENEGPRQTLGKKRAAEARRPGPWGRREAAPTPRYTRGD